MDNEKWINYLINAKPNELPKAWKFVKETIKDQREYEDILDEAIKREAEQRNNTGKKEIEKFDVEKYLEEGE